MYRLTTILAGVCAVAVTGGGALAGCGVSRQGAAPPGVNCGSAVTRSLDDRTQLLSAKPGALPCFDAAARNCRAASITVTAMGVDAGTRYVFVIKPGTEPCQVTEQSQFYMVSGGGGRHGPIKTVACQRSAVTRSGVTLSCGGRGILIPAELRMSVDRGEAAS
jgi:hypothetical protein